MMLVCCQCQVVPIFTCKHGYVISHLKHFEYEAVASNEAFQVHGDAWSALYSLSNCSKVLRTCGGFPLLRTKGYHEGFVSITLVGMADECQAQSIFAMCPLTKQ